MNEVLNEQLISTFKQCKSWPHVEQVLKVLSQNHFTAWLAGGCVRDALLGRPIKDFDLVTDAKVEQIEKLFDRTIAVGKQFGVVRVIIDHESIEVATFRKDIGYSDGRRPSQVVKATPEEDAHRRDFTINGLFYDPAKQTIVDYVGGIVDLKHNILTTIGIAQDRFSEDKLRILRALRFVAQLDVKIDQKTWQAVQTYRREVSIVSPERITEELRKMISGHFANKGIAKLVKSGVADVILPSVNLRTWKLFIATLRAAIQHDEQLNLSEVLGLLGFYQKQLIQSSFLRLSGKEFDSNKIMFDDLNQISKRREWQPAQLLPILEGERGESVLKVYSAHCRAHLGSVQSADWYREQKFKFLGANGELPPPWFSGSDLKLKGYSPGPLLGQLLEELYAGQLNQRWLSREGALKWLNLKQPPK